MKHPQDEKHETQLENQLNEVVSRFDQNRTDPLPRHRVPREWRGCALEDEPAGSLAHLAYRMRRE